MSQSPFARTLLFIDELKQRFVPQVFYTPDNGTCRIVPHFNDPEGLLETAFDFLHVLKCGGITVETVRAAVGSFESYSLETAPGFCRISANDTEGIRRGIYYLAGILQNTPPAQLPIRKMERHAWLKTRISRCYFGPIRRPPFNRDELLDDIDYYPEAYLERLAFEGINGLWLTIRFEDLCRTRFTPDAAPDRDRRFAKLQRTIDKCRRYGIRIYLFCNEPEAWSSPSRAAAEFPMLAGPEKYGRRTFCPCTPEGNEYLYESLNQIFSRLKHAGGMINISLGEGLTTCLSSLSNGKMNCPKNCGKAYSEIMYTALDSMSRGMHDADPDALLVSWFYLPQAEPLPDWYYSILKETPRSVVMQLNAESGIELEQLGKKRTSGDYWQFVDRLSDNYIRFAEGMKKNGHEVSVKLQVGSSHEIATVPFVPIPATLYRKFKKLAGLGVRHAMLCWYFGSYPGIMNQASGELAFTDFSRTTETDFLKILAESWYGRSHAETAVRGWRLLSDACRNYPLSNMFQYLGPCPAGAVWALYLKPVQKPLLSTWIYSEETGGDTVSDCLDNHTLEEIETLLDRLSKEWNRGWNIFRKLLACDLSETGRKDIHVIEAIGLQFAIAGNIMRFYRLRQNFYDHPQNIILDEMHAIAEMEIRNRERLIELLRKDSRLGFHPEAETYLYDEPRIREAIASIRQLKSDFNELASGRLPGYVPNAVYLLNSGSLCKAESFSWCAEFTRNTLTIEVFCEKHFRTIDELFLAIDDRCRHYPWRTHFASDGRIHVISPGGRVETEVTPEGWRARLEVDRTDLPGGDPSKLRLNIIRFQDDYRKQLSWPACTHPIEGRIMLAFYQPDRMGDLLSGTGKENTVFSVGSV